MSPARYDLAIVGGGFSGTALAFALAKTLPSAARIALIERGTAGAGVAYDAAPGMLMNGPARAMSALESEALDLVRYAGCAPDELVERRLYGAYLRDVLRRARETHPGITVVTADVHDIVPASGGYHILGESVAIDARSVVLATGTPPPSRRALPATGPTIYQNPWKVPNAELSGDVAVVGSGLTALDTIAALAENPRIGTVWVISRSGRLPLEERPELRAAAPEALALDAASPLRLLRTLRRAAARDTYDWRSVVDAIRRSTPAIWSAWTPRQRRQFLRHAAPMWSIHRFRAPSATLERARTLEAQGRLRFWRGTIDRVEVETQLGLFLSDGGHISVDAAVNATGPSFTEAFHTQPLLRTLRARRAIAPDELGLGIAIDGDLRALGTYPGLFVIGPATRSRWYEATAIPEIRRQADRLAAYVAATAFESAGAA